MNKRVLVIIANYNSSEYIGDCLSSLGKATYPKDKFEILVVDNNSSDNSVEIIKKDFPNVKLIENKQNLGFTGGNNLGFQSALTNDFDYVYLLNQDTVVKPDFLEKAVGLAQTSAEIGAVQSKLMLYNSQLINSIGNEMHFLGFGYAGGYKLKDFAVMSKEITYPSGASVLIRTAALKAVGFFNNEFFMYHEDTDLGWRLWLGGYKVILAPDSVVYHKYEFSRSIRQYYFMERNRRLMILQNYKMGTLLLVAPAGLAMGLVMFAYSFISGWWKEILKVYWYFLKPSSWLKLLKTRRSVQERRLTSDREVIKRFIGKIEFQEVSNPLLIYLVNPVFNLYWQLIKRLIWW